MYDMINKNYKWAVRDICFITISDCIVNVFSIPCIFNLNELKLSLCTYIHIYTPNNKLGNHWTRRCTES